MKTILKSHNFSLFSEDWRLETQVLALWDSMMRANTASSILAEFPDWARTGVRARSSTISQMTSVWLQINTRRNWVMWWKEVKVSCSRPRIRVFQNSVMCSGTWVQQNVKRLLRLRKSTSTKKSLQMDWNISKGSICRIRWGTLLLLSLEV